MLREVQLNLTIDQGTGLCRAYVLELRPDGQWEWLSDQEFGPFETTLDIVSWLTRILAKKAKLPLR